MSHPSDLKLERHLFDPGQSQIGDHLSGCEHCQGRLLGDAPAGRGLPPLRLSGRRWTRPRGPVEADAGPVAAGAGGGSGYRAPCHAPGAARGLRRDQRQPLELTVYVARDSGAHAWQTASRFRPRPPSACGCTRPPLASLPSFCRWKRPESNLYASPGKVSGAFELPGTVRLDGKVARNASSRVCEAPKEPLEEAIRRVAGDREEGVGIMHALESIPRSRM